MTAPHRASPTVCEVHVGGGAAILELAFFFGQRGKLYTNFQISRAFLSVIPQAEGLPIDVFTPKSIESFLGPRHYNGERGEERGEINGNPKVLVPHRYLPLLLCG
ncbi:hypothetical protein J6590_014178 [Homalodisca vitripennis]|nr:hypothetical protein J6590_014178 [Homalodisca vitripennis]